MAKIFINYRASDEMFAAALLEEALAARFGGEEVFRDSNAIWPGIGDFRKVLWPTLAGVSVLIAVIGPGWLGVDDAGHRRIDEPDDYVRRRYRSHSKSVSPWYPYSSALSTCRSVHASRLHPRSAFRQYLRLDARTTRDDSARVVDAVVRIVEPSASSQAGEESAPTAAARRRAAAVCAEPDSDRRGSQDDGVGPTRARCAPRDRHCRQLHRRSIPRRGVAAASAVD